MLVVACNSIEVSAIGDIAVGAGIPVVGVDRPGGAGRRPATRNGVIGVIGTEATVASGAYERAVGAGAELALGRLPGLRRARRARRHDRARAAEGRAQGILRR